MLKFSELCNGLKMFYDFYVFNNVLLFLVEFKNINCEYIYILYNKCKKLIKVLKIILDMEN